MKKKNIHAVRLGRLGGKAGTGKAKARTSFQARKASLARFKNKAFTLIELLVVIAIMALLVGIIIPTYNNVREKAKETKAKAEVKGLETALKSYVDQYRVWPKDWSGKEKIEDTVFKVLAGDNEGKIVFYEFSNTNKNDFNAYDSWRNPYDEEGEQKRHVCCFAIDDDYDNVIKLNDQEIRRSVVVWSPGKNGTNEYGEGDDVASWK